MNSIWVVEILDNGEWEPTIGVGLTRNDARSEKYDWQKDNPDDRFRVRKYVRQEVL